MSNPYNRRAYVRYMYTGKPERLQWKNITNSKYKNEAQAYAMYTLGTLDDNGTKSTLKAFYPIDDTLDNNASRTITSYTEKNSGSLKMNYITKCCTNNTNCGEFDGLSIWGSEGTNKRKRNKCQFRYPWGNGINQNYIKRDNTQIKTYIYNSSKNAHDVYVTKDTGNQILFNIPAEAEGNLFKINTNIPYHIYDLIDIEYFVFTQYWDKSNDPINIDGKTTIDSIAHDEKGSMNVRSTDTNIYLTEGSFSKGEFYIDFYDTTDINSSTPVESFALPAWGRLATRSTQTNKVVHAWFKKRNNIPKIACIVLRRENPRKIKLPPVKLMINDILFFNAETEGAFVPQMQMRIYPNNKNVMKNTKIRKIGGVYRL